MRPATATTPHAMFTKRTLLTIVFLLALGTLFVGPLMALATSLGLPVAP